MDQAHFASLMAVVLTRASERILLVLVGALLSAGCGVVPGSPW